jgi:hypothetical protein
VPPRESSKEVRRHPTVDHPVAACPDAARHPGMALSRSSPPSGVFSGRWATSKVGLSRVGASV